jgi:LacI family gluconate utilization system Gnt-I transcriptional repressor
MSNRRSASGPTLDDVARLAGCSPITASRALNTPELVSAVLRSRVETAIATLGYRPNLNARALASIRTNVIGVLVPSLTQHIFADVLRGVYDGVQATRYQVQLGNTHYSLEEEERLIGEFLRQKPAGMIVSGIDQNPAATRMLAEAGCPVVQIMDLTDRPIDRLVGFSHFEAGYAMGRHLLDQGYRRIGFMAGWMNKRSSGRMLGCRRALEEAGVFDERLVVATVGDEPLGQPTDRPLGEATHALHGRTMLRRLQAVGGGLDAVFCNNDVLALGVLFETIAQGIAVPGALGIAGFNDTDIVIAAEPGLTSVRTRRYEIGRRAVAELVADLEQRGARERVIDLGSEVVARASTDRLGRLAHTATAPAAG